jgi:hypothetical protein
MDPNEARHLLEALASEVMNGGFRPEPAPAMTDVDAVRGQDS